MSRCAIAGDVAVVVATAATVVAVFVTGGFQPGVLVFGLKQIRRTTL